MQTMRVCFVFSTTVYTEETTPSGERYVEEDLHLGTPFTKTLDPRRPYVEPPAVPRVTKAQLDVAPRVATPYQISYRLHRELERKSQGQAIAKALGLATMSSGDSSSQHSHNGSDSVPAKSSSLDGVCGEDDERVVDSTEVLRPPKRRKCTNDSYWVEQNTKECVLVLPGCQLYDATVTEV